MSKNRFMGHAPRPTKGALTAAAKEQTSKGEPVEITAKDVGDARKALGEIVGDQKLADSMPLTPVVDHKAARDSVVGPPPANGAAPVNEQAAIASAAPPAPAGAAPPSKEEPRYMLGKKYAPKTDRNSETWGKITKALNEGPKTMKELAEVVKGHGDFLGYMTRGGHVVPYAKKEAVAATA